MSLMIQLEKVDLTYFTKHQRVDLFKNFDLSIDHNEYTVILGRSGSGKTTILNLIAGFLTPTGGNILVDGQDISKYNDSELNRYRNKTIGYIFQFFNLINQFNVIENVMVPLLIEGVSKSKAKERALQLLKEVELEDRTMHFPNELSGGEQQRVSIARALANNPSIILADEPTGNLDIETGKTILSILDKIHKSGKNIVMVTHEEEIANRATRVIYMNEL